MTETGLAIINDGKQYKGIDYIIYRVPEAGYFCGYVKVPELHPWVDHLKKINYSTLFSTGKRITIRQYDKIPVECHGGLTFGKHITKKGGRFSPGWWIGWDYAHVGDFITVIEADNTVFVPEPEGKIWDYSEVEAECKSVIDQMLNTKL